MFAIRTFIYLISLHQYRYHFHFLSLIGSHDFCEFRCQNQGPYLKMFCCMILIGPSWRIGRYIHTFKQFWHSCIKCWRNKKPDYKLVDSLLKPFLWILNPMIIKASKIEKHIWRTLNVDKNVKNNVSV